MASHRRRQCQFNNAKRLNTLFYEKFKLLAGMPGIGRSRDDLKTGWRSFPAGSYVIYYRETKTGIEILHIVHGARDLDALLGV
ncbi:MAG: type II toxin-antitoxin system RelE/ParE family toxin [Acidobacteria bacterium]|nr:type II toxin-antitoxin system RelE/ParE family toxin [Acidobacteriota bacterium]